MTDIQLYIDGKIIYTPPGFTLTFDEESPLIELETIITGGIAFDIRFPFGENKITMQHANRIDIVDRKIAYTAEVYSNGELKVKGVFMLQGSAEQAAYDGIFRGSIINNYIALLLNKPLSDIMTKKVELGTTPAAIIAAARAQTIAAMSTNGISGSVLKFIPTYSPDFYGDTNKDWLNDTSEYKMESEYKLHECVEFRLPEFTNQHPVPADIPYAMIPKVFRALAATLDGESPFSRSDKWYLLAQGVLNATDEGLYKQNKIYSPISNSINRNALLPSIQTHDVFREIAKALGYTIKGQYMDDPIEQRALLFSNMALDKSSGSPNYIYVGRTEIFPITTYQSSQAPDSLVHLDLQDGIYQNENGIYVNPPAIPTVYGTGTYVPVVAGPCLVKWKCLVRNNEATTHSVTIGVSRFSPDEIVSQITRDLGANQTETVEIEVYVDLEAGGRYVPFATRFTVGSMDLLQCTLDIKNIETDFVNIYEGTVNYADHMPNTTAINFLLAHKVWKNLYIGFDDLTKTITVDYADRILKEEINTTDISKYKKIGHDINFKPKKRFELNYGLLDDIYEKPGNITELDAIAAVQNLPPPTQPNVCILVRNTNSYYVTREYDYGGRLFWDFAGYAWYDLKIEAEGELFSIKPDLGPVPMGRFQCVRAYETLGPVYNDKGRSAMYLPGGKRPGIKIMYWIGMDANLQEDGVPYASTTGTTATGTTVLPRDMTLLAIYRDHWKRTLQMIVLEEIITAHYHFTPQVRQLLNFSKLFLLGHVPVIPIRTSTVIDSRSSSGVEVEMRRGKMVEVEIISGEAEPEPEVELWTPAQITTELWLDFADEFTVTLESLKISQTLDKSGNLRHAIQGTAVNRPGYEIHDLSGKKAYTNDESNKFLISSFTLAAGSYTIFQVFQNAKQQWHLPIGARSHQDFGVKSHYESEVAYYRCSYVNASLGNILPLNTLAMMSGSQTIAAGTLTLCIGGDPGFTYRRVDGQIMEYLILPGTLSTDLRQKIEGYLAHKWALIDQLPLDHPYRVNAPEL